MYFIRLYGLEQVVREDCLKQFYIVFKPLYLLFDDMRVQNLPSL